MKRHIPKEYKEIAIHMSLNEGVTDLAAGEGKFEVAGSGEG